MGEPGTSAGPSSPTPSLTELLHQRAAAAPGAVAVAVEGAGVLTYGEWARRAGAAAGGLAGRGVSAGDRVVLLFDRARWVDFAVAYIAALRAGAVAVPLAPRLAPVEVARIVADCGAGGVVGPADLVPAGAAGWSAEVADLEEGPAGDASSPVPAVGELGAPSPPPPGNQHVARSLPRPSPGAAAPAEVLYAPATMGRARPAARSHAEVADDPLPGLLGAGAPPTVLLHAFAPGTDAAQQALRLPLHLPAATSALAGFDPERFWEVVSADGVEAVGLPGPLAAAVVAAAPGWPAASVRHVVVTAPVPSGLPDRLAACFPAASVRTLASPAPLPTPPPARPAAVVGLADAGAPLHPSQEGMLWHEQFAPGSLNLPPLVRRYRGRLDTGVLERALVEIVRRHAPLRTNFEVRDGHALQVPGRPLERVPVVDLGHLPPAEQEAEVAALVSRAATRPFDLVGDPLFAPVLVRLADDDHLLVVRVHHIVYDDWCGDVFRRELSTLYAAFLAGEASPLADLLVQFADHCRAHREALDGPAGEAQLSWWRRELAGAPLAVQVPIGDPDLPDGTPMPASEPQSVDVPRPVAERLRALARSERATPFMAVLAAAGVVLSRYTGQDDLVVATVVANRNRTELEALISSFSKKVPLRLRLGGDPTFLELLGRARQAVLGTWAHQDPSYEAVVQEALGADAARHGLVPSVGVMFQAQAPQRARLTLPGLTVSAYQPPRATATQMHYLARPGEPADPAESPGPWGGGAYLGTFLNLTLVDDGDTLSCVARGVFHPPSARRLLAHLQAVLADAVANPTRPVSELRLADEGEGPPDAGPGGRPGARSGGDPRTTSDDASFPGRFRKQVEATPDRAAVESGGRPLTYRELEAGADDLARRLRARGVASEEVVGVCLAPSPELCVAVVGIWMAGAAFVALDPDASAGHLDTVLSDCGVRLAVTGPTSPPALARHGVVPVVVGPDGREAADEGAVEGGGDTLASATVLPPVGPRSLACVSYASSGAGGAGVEIEHGGLVALARAVCQAIGEAERGADAGDDGRPRRVGALGPDGSFLRQLAGLLHGDTLRVAAAGGEGGAAEVVSWLREGGADVVHCTVAGLGDLLGAGLEAAAAARPGGRPPPVVVAGCDGPVETWLWRLARRPSPARVALVHGSAECGFAVAGVAPAGAGLRPVAGRPLVGVGASVLDPRGRPVPEGGVGVLHVSGPGLARGYRGRPAMTAARFSPCHSAAGSRWWGSGQLTRRLRDGALELLGPVDDHLELRGFRVRRSAVEALLARCPGVAHANLSVGDDSTGSPRLVARVVVEEGARPRLEHLPGFLWGMLPGSPWPAELVVVDARDGSPLPACPDDGAPSTPDEHLLASWWAAAAGAGAASHSYWQDFTFSEAVDRVHEAGIGLTAHDVARCRTVHMLAAAVAGRRMPQRRP